MCNLFSNIAAKQVEILPPLFKPVTVKPGQAYPPRMHQWIYYSKVESVASYRFQIDLCILACVMSGEFTREAVMKFLPAQFSWIWCKCLLRNLIHSKIFNLTKYSEVLVKYSQLITHAEMPLWIWHQLGEQRNGFIFQIINSLIESWGVCLTCLDCNNLTCWKTGLMWEVNVQHCYSTPFAAVLHYELHVFCCPVCHTIKWSGTQIKLYNLRAPHKNVPWEKEMGITPGTFLLALCLSFVICVDLNSPKTTKQYNLLFCKPLLKLFYSW